MQGISSEAPNRKLYSYFIILIFMISIFSCLKKPKPYDYGKRASEIPDKKKTWVFIMAGQSNMAGRAQIEPQDTILNSRILTINKNNELIVAKEPLHFYEYPKNGLDCGVSFATTLLERIPKDITLLLLPTAVGATSIDQWLTDDIHEDVKLLSNFKEKVRLAQKYGQLKGILWHQGESDAINNQVLSYKNKLLQLIEIFRDLSSNEALPIILGKLGSFSKDNSNWQKINSIIEEVATNDQFTTFIETSDLNDKGDYMHFDAGSIRIMGHRYSDKYVDLLNLID